MSIKDYRTEIGEGLISAHNFWHMSPEVVEIGRLRAKNATLREEVLYLRVKCATQGKLLRMCVAAMVEVLDTPIDGVALRQWVEKAE